MADVGNANEAAAAGDPGDNGQAPNQPEQRPPPAARRAPPVNRGTEGGAGGGGSRDPLINMRDRLFHTLFYRLTLAYARACPKSVRRLLETMVLLKVRVHSVNSRRHPTTLTLFLSRPSSASSCSFTST